MDLAAEFKLYATSHSNAIGYLYELCAKQKVEAPKTTCLASKPGEYVLRMTAFSLQHTGIGARKNEAKTIAACKILIQLGYLQAPIPHADQPKELPSSTGSATTISETNQWYSEKAQVRTEINPNVGGATSVPFSLSAVAVPAFNRDNPLLSVNWILRNADKALVQVQFVQLTPEDGCKDLWRVVCTAGEYNVSFSAQSKRKALVAAGELMYNSLLNNAEIQDLLRKFEQSMVKKPPVKKVRTTPANWGVFCHRLFLPGQIMHRHLVQHNGWEDEVASSSGDLLTPAEKKLTYLASQMGFFYRIITWPQGEHFFRSKKRKLKQHDTSSIESGKLQVLLSLFISFTTNKQALSFHGHGPSIELAREAAAEGALRYFRVMTLAADGALERKPHVTQDVKTS